MQRYERLHSEPLNKDAVSTQHKKSLVSTLHVWLDGYPEDWNEDILKKLISFTSIHLSSSELHHKALTKLDRLARTKSVPLLLPWHDDYIDFESNYQNLCLTPVFMTHEHLLQLQVYQFPDIHVRHFAEQLTRMDMVIFLKKKKY